MKAPQNLFYSLAVFLMVSCSKNNDTDNSPTAIDVSAQWKIDPLGLLISAPADGQWQSKTFTADELNLFASLDTANLSGTNTPASGVETPGGYIGIYPNPFNTEFAMRFGFTGGYTGPYVFKYVIVDSLMKPVDRKAVRLQASIYPGPGNPSSNSFRVSPVMPNGRYRYYFTVSSQLNPHFYKSWGNIQKY